MYTSPDSVRKTASDIYIFFVIKLIRLKPPKIFLFRFLVNYYFFDGHIIEKNMTELRLRCRYKQGQQNLTGIYSDSTLQTLQGRIEEIFGESSKYWDRN